jgi:hypothetical protein
VHDTVEDKSEVEVCKISNFNHEPSFNLSLPKRMYTNLFKYIFKLLNCLKRFHKIHPLLLSINRSMFPVTPIWSIRHSPHTATELFTSLPPSPRSSSDLQLWPPFELIFSRYYSVVPFIFNLVESIQEPFSLHWREVSAVYAPTIPIYFYYNNK